MNWKLFMILCVIKQCLSECDCGRGGLCLKYGDDPSTGISANPCHCDKVSKGIFQPSVNYCDTITTDFCNPKPCTHGSCYSGFGTFICKCYSWAVPSGWKTRAGHRCDQDDISSYSHFVTLWYQMTQRTEWVPTIAAGRLSLKTKLVFEFEYGRKLVKRRKTCHPVTRNQVLDECQMRGGGPDCQILSFTLSNSKAIVQCHVVLPFSLERAVFVDGVIGPVGHYHDVKFQAVDGEVIHLNATYRVFLETGEMMRKCPYQVKISGCGKLPTSAKEVISSEPLSLFASSPFIDYHNTCPVKSKSYKWFLSLLDQGNFVKIGARQSVTVVPSLLGFRSGIATATVEITFQGMVDMADETVVMMCYVNLNEKALSIYVNEAYLKYSCDVWTTVTIVPTIINLRYPEDELRFDWTCPVELCKDVSTKSKDLIAGTNTPCDLTYFVKLVVSHPPTNTEVKWEGELVFVSGDGYEINLFFDPDSTVVNPMLPLTITASNTLKVTQNYSWSPKLFNESNCGTGVRSHIFMIPPNSLEPGRNYSFQVVSDKGSKNFTIQTAFGPSEFSCAMYPNTSLILHVDKYNLTCVAKTSSLPLTYYVYEGDSKEMVMISSLPQMTGILINYVPIQVEVEDSIGMRSYIQISVEVQTNSTDYWDVLDAVEERMEYIPLLIHDHDYPGVASEIDSITKIIDYNFPFSWGYTLMEFLTRVKVCNWEECIIKTVGSIRRLIALDLEGKRTHGGVDRFILFGTGTIYRMTQSLKEISRTQPYAVYRMMRVLSLVHNAARELMDLSDKLLKHSAVDEDVRRSHYRKVQQGNEYSRKAIAELGLFITSNIPHPAFPFELISDLSDEKTTIISHFPNHINCIEALDESKSFFQLSQGAINKLEQSGFVVSVAIVNYKKNKFWWSDNTNVSMGEILEVHMYKKKIFGNKWVHMTESVGTIQAIVVSPESSETGTVRGKAVMPKPDAQTPDELDSFLYIHRITVPRGFGAVHLTFPEELTNFVRFTIGKSKLPTYREAETSPAMNNNNIVFRYYSDEAYTNIYISILAIQSEKEYSFNLSLVRCVRFSERMWKSELCRLEGHTKDHAVACICEHLSLLNTETSVPEFSTIHISTLHLTTTINDCWYAAVMLTVVLIILTLLYFITSSLEWRNKPKRYVSFFGDNWPGEDYPYLVAVYTGGRCMSGTSSNVAIRLFGDETISRVHILTWDENRTPLTWGQDCWFILFTKANLKKIRHIEMWHDGIGYAPDWYCTEVLIWDINTGERFQFPVRSWISFTSLYKNRDSIFRFEVIDLKMERKWWSYIFSHIHAKLRQEHHWLSVFLLHPRSRYTRLDRLLLVSVIVMVTVATTMVFYTDNLGPADRPKVKITANDMYVSFKTVFVAYAAVVIPALLFSIGRNELTIGTTYSKSSVGKLLRRFFLYPVTYKAIMTEDRYQSEKKKWNSWVWVAYVFSAGIICACVAFIVKSSLNFRLNRSIAWLIASMVSLWLEALIINPIQVVVTAILLAYIFRLSARDIVTITIFPDEDFVWVKNERKRLDRMLHFRVKAMYKPPLSFRVKARATRDSRFERFDVTHIIVISLSLILIPFLIFYLKKELMYHKHLQFTELYEEEGSSDEVFDLVRNRSRYFSHLRGTVLRSLHHYAWYNGLPLHPNLKMANDTWRPTLQHIGFCSDFSTQLIGVPQIRQQRVMPDSNKTVASEFRQYFQHAYGPLEVLNEDTNTYLPNWKTPIKREIYYKVYRYEPTDKARSTKFYGVSRRAYDGGGYVEHLHWSLGLSQSILVDLELDNWLDNLTRSIFFTFNLYSVFEEKISYVTIITECLPSGVYRSRAMTESASVSTERYSLERTVAIIVLCIAIVITLHFVRTATVISKNGFVKYLKSISGFIDVSLIVTGYGLVVAFINRYFQFFAALEEVESTTKDSYTSLHSRFNQNYIALVFIGAFSFTVTGFASLMVHNLIGFEAINLSLARTRALLVAFGGINLFAVYVSLSLSYFGSGDVPNLFFLLFFKESTAIQDTLALASYYANFLLLGVVGFLILTRLNLAILVHFYAEAASLIEPKTAAFKDPFLTLRSRLKIIQMLRSEPKKQLTLRRMLFRSKSKDEKFNIGIIPSEIHVRRSASRSRRGSLAHSVEEVPSHYTEHAHHHGPTDGSKHGRNHRGTPETTKHDFEYKSDSL